MIVPGPLDFTDQIVRLTSVGLASAMRRILQLEAARLNLPYGSTVASQRVTVKDGGEDGATVGVPEGLETRLPIGRTLFQFKTNAELGAVKREVLKEIEESPRPRGTLEAGGNYIVVWNRDAVGRESDELLEAMREKVGLEAADRVHVWSVAAIEELLTTNPAALVELGMVPGMAVLPFERWAPGERQSIPTYVADEERTAKIAQLRRAIVEGEEILISHVEGDAGVGKTRLVVEVLDEEGFREQTVYGTPDTVRSYINYVVTLPDAHCILFVDDIEPSELDGLRKAIQPALGRIRLITAGLPGEYRSSRPTGNDIRLGVLESEALYQLIREQIGLPESSARWVVELSEGYPRLAIFVAGLIQKDSDALGSIGEAIENRDIQVLLDTMLPDRQRQERLGILALFSQVGVDGPRGVELDAVADAFELDPALLRQTLEEEIGRFVSRAGALRSVTPLLMAVWLASKVLKGKGSGIAQTIANLPEPLPERFRDQLVYLREAPIIRAVVEELLKRPEFKEPADFDQAAAGFLRAAAAANPEQVASVLSELFAQLDDASLAAEDFPRRDLVWALEQLLWPRETYDLAVDLLLRLAETENETFSNNATGVLTDSFQLHLGGTEAPYVQRLAWVDSKTDGKVDPTRLEILASCLASGLRNHQVRSHGTRPDEIGVRDWHPRTWDEEIEARRGAWNRLAQLVLESSGELRKAVFPKIAQAVRESARARLADVVLDTLGAGDWDLAERAALSAPLRDMLSYDAPDEEWRDRIEGVIEKLSGDSFAERVNVVFRSTLWDLHEDREWMKAPRVVEELAAEAAGDRAKLTSALAATESVEDRNTAYSFWRLVAQSADPKELAEMVKGSAEGELVVFQAALTAAQAEDAQWVDEQLRLFLADPDRAANGVQLVQAVGIDDARAGLLLEAVEEGLTPREKLSELLYGAAVRGLSPQFGLRVIERAAAAGTPLALEHAIGMLHQYAESDGGFFDDPARRELATRLASEAVAIGGGRMGSHYAYELAEALPVPDALTILRARLVNQRTLPEPAEAALLDRTFEQDEKLAAAWALELLEEATTEPRPGWGLWMEGLHLLSRVGEVNAEEVWRWFQRQDESSQIRLVRHIDFGPAQPGAFLSLLLGDTESEAVLSEASAAYFNSLGTVSGPYHLGLQRQLDRLRNWGAQLNGRGRVWVDQQIEACEKMIPEQRRREEEEDALLR